MMIAQLTDFHIGPPDKPDPPGFDRDRDLERVIAAINARDPRPSLAVATGDLVDEASQPEYERLAPILRRLQVPLYAVPGNHDAAEPFVQGLEGIAHTGPARPHVQAAHLIDDPAFGPFRLLLLDTHAPRRTGGVFCADRLSWLEAELAAAPDVPVVIAMHHPPFNTGIPVFESFGFEGLEAFRRLIEDAPQVGLIFCGHIHRSLTGRVGGAPVVVAPSTAIALTLEHRPGQKLAHSFDPPGFVLHQRTGPRDWVSHVHPLPRP